MKFQPNNLGEDQKETIKDLSSIQITEGTPADAQAIERVRRTTRLTQYKGIIPDDYLQKKSPQYITKEIIEHIQERLRGKDMKYFLAKDNKEIIGFVGLNYGPERPEGFDIDLQTAYILPEYQWKWIGTRLFRQAVQRSLEQGYKSMSRHILEANPSVAFVKRYWATLKKTDTREKTYDENKYFSLPAQLRGRDDISHIKFE